MQMIIGLLTLDLLIPPCGSLKEKRTTIKSIKDKIRNKYNVSIAEIDFQDKWQRARIAVVQVGNDYQYIEKNLNSVFKIIDTYGIIEITNHSVEYL
jgi:uncharacterized protein YlxP (DUF503 family)